MNWLRAALRLPFFGSMIFIYSIKDGMSRKIGISNSPNSRLKRIQANYKRARFAVVLPTPFIAHIIEKAFHKLLSPFNESKREGSGKTEWFRLWFFGFVVDWALTAVVALSWWGVWELYGLSWYLVELIKGLY